MEYIHGKVLEEALKSNDRIYLCGDLKRPQACRWIHDESSEMGVSFYKGFTADRPHYHTAAMEYNYVVQGRSKILLIEEDQELEFEAGSVFVIPPMTKYASKHLGDTKILFFKTPGGDDKQLITVDGGLQAWLGSW